MNYRTLNNLSGWIVFIIALSVYVSTIEPTASMWDCSEFIACAYKLQVSHAPGAPLFMMVARLFTLIAGNDAQKVAMMINLLSALASALTVMFLFWTITILVHRAMSIDKDNGKKQIVMVLSAGFIGSLSFAFTDSFWFSAVEAEVYALSSFLTALVFWAILRWDSQTDRLYATRWLLFIVFVMSLSIGVHLLNLLAIPAILFILLAKNKSYNKRIIFRTLIISILVLGFMMIVFIPGIARIAAAIDLFCVNLLNLPFNSGLYVTFILLASILTLLLIRATRKKNITGQAIILSLIFMIAGYTSYLSILIRSQENIPVDMNNPDNPFSLFHYLNREHYGSRPLFYGPYYNAPVTGVAERTTHIPFEGKYAITTLNPTYKYDKRFMTIFPRMNDNSSNYIDAYKYWGKIKGKKISISINGKTETIIKPVFIENVRFFLRYQIGYMYWRYFFWNFIGRQDDVQGLANALHGNWLSGISFIDRARLGSQDELPSSVDRNKARNKYYFLPLLTGIFGMIWHYRRNKTGFTATLLLFLFAGMAISVYLNEIPVTPRERDYVYVGSYYAFCIWIGSGAAAIYSFIKKYLPVIPSLFLSMVATSAIPVILLKENRDDHDRSNRYAARDFGYDYLNSCRKNAILFTNGDNDTYPVWYNQEVESVRTDIRIVLQPYLGADWYIDQLRSGINQAGSLPISFSREKLLNGKRSIIQLVNRFEKHVELREALEFIKSDNPKTKLLFNDSNYRNYLPAKKLKLTLDKERLVESGNFTRDEIKKTEDAVYFEIHKNYLLRSDLMLLDIIAGNNWERPLYFLSPMELRNLGLDKYLVREGFAYRLVPYKNEPANPPYTYQMDAGNTFNLLMEKFRWGNIGNAHVYLDDTIRRQIEVMGIRRTFSQLASLLIKAGDNRQAEKVLDKCMELLPFEVINDDYFITRIIAMYFDNGCTEKGSQKMKEYAGILDEELQYYTSHDRKFKKEIPEAGKNYLYYLNELLSIAKIHHQTVLIEKYKEKFEHYYACLTTMNQ
jgi:hypothetical protein